MLALRAGALFDGHNRRGPSDVLIDASRISAVQPTAERADAVEVVDLGSDVTLVPGLVDPHVHLVFDASLDVVSSVQAASDDELDRRMRAAGRMALAGGVTTVLSSVRVYCDSCGCDPGVSWPPVAMILTTSVPRSARSATARRASPMPPPPESTASSTARS